MNAKPLFFGLATFLVAVYPQAKMLGEPTSPTPSQTQNSGADVARAREFQGDDLGQVLRLLARQAKINLVVGQKVSGTISVRLEDKTAMETIEILARANKLTLTKDDKGVYYIGEPELTKTASADEAKDADENATEDNGEAQAGKALGYLVRPETANNVAKYKRNLFNALVKEGFSPDQAIQIVAADRTALEIVEHFEP